MALPLIPIAIGGLIAGGTALFAKVTGDATENFGEGVNEASKGVTRIVIAGALAVGLYYYVRMRRK